jgi:hypothetical protein
MAVGDLHDGPGDLEIVEVLGVHLADGLSVPGRGEVIDRSGRCLARVVPALECDYQRWRGELAGGIELDRPPPPSAAACTSGELVSAYVPGCDRSRVRSPA